MARIGYPCKGERMGAAVEKSEAHRAQGMPRGGVDEKLCIG